MSYAAFGLARAKHPQRFGIPFVIWSAIVLPPTAILLYWRPWLLWIGLAYAALPLVNMRYARRGDERALANDAVFVAECAGMVAVTWTVGDGERSWTPPGLDAVPVRVWILVGICALVLFGSTLHVKSLIRERGDRRFAHASRAVAVASVPVPVVLSARWGWPSGAWLVAPFVALAARSVAVPRRAQRPGAIGIFELGCFILVTAADALAST
ncbi:MAG: YwiC-like family protein [Candidatus Nanopelagicales bacterium]